MIMQNQVQWDQSTNNALQLKVPHIVIVTGYSGAGKNTVLHSLEDIGFFCINNLPGSLLQPFFESLMRDEIAAQRIALGLDVRGDIAAIIPKLYRFKSVWPFSLKIVFVTSSYEILLKRFQETRRRHPLANVTKDISDAIKEERVLLQPLCDMADILLDTDQFTINQLRRFVIKAFSSDGAQKMVVTVTAFGFKYGVPPESNLLFDVRFLPNPYFEPTLKQLCGTDQPVYDYLFAQPMVQDYWLRLHSFATYVIHQSLAEGRFAMNIAIGCTGGRHRSVALAHRLAQSHIEHVTFLTRFRDIMRDTDRDYTHEGKI
jgi:UPF0042 nucleotide-binding protein